MSPEDREPDYRFTLANERTFLAWVRTALALLAGAVAVVQLIPRFGYHDLRHVLGLVLAALGVVVSIGSVRRWQQVERAMRRSEPLPSSQLPWLLGAGLAVVAVLVGVFIAVSAGRQ